MSSDAEPVIPNDHSVDPADGKEPVVDACGCVPPPAPQLRREDTRAAAEDGPSDNGNSLAHRTVKLVALLRPTTTGYQAQLAAGAEGCDPELRVVEAPDLPSALAALPEVLAAAEARWHERPRYPDLTRAPAPPRARPPSAVTAANSSSAMAGTERFQEQTPPASLPAAAGQSSSDQLPLFG